MLSVAVSCSKGFIVYEQIALLIISAMYSKVFAFFIETHLFITYAPL